MPLDIVLRTAGAGTLLLTAMLFLRSAPRSALARAFLAFALGLSGFLGVNTAFDAAELPDALWPVASFLSRMAVVAVWLFCLVLFDGRLRSPAAALAVAAAWFALVVLDKGYIAPVPPGLPVSALLIVFGAGLLLHAGWRVMRDLRDDLVETRRRARPVFALALLALVALDFAVDLLQGYGWRPASFLMLQNGSIAALAVGLAVWLLRPDPAWIAAAPRPAPLARVDGPPAEAGIDVAGGPAGTDPDADAAILARLQAVMRDERPYLDPGLTFSAFAARVGAPEPVLRRVINHRLGHGHFRVFLNEYRVAEARRRLRDPAASGDKILAIAFDSGFSSLASFNRAFKQTVGCAPSEYRMRGIDLRCDAGMTERS